MEHYDWDVHFGDDAPGLEVRVHDAADGARRAVIVPRGAAPLTSAQADSLHDLQRVVLGAQVAAGALDEPALHARDEGVPWALIAWSVGADQEVARRRWERRGA